MAKKRMLSVEFFTSDEFLRIQNAVQVLYIQLNLAADDDGFVGNPMAITKMIGAKKSAFAELCDRGYLILFPSGVAVIRHWHLHNTIKKDRYTPTIHQKEFEALKLENHLYELKNNKEEDEESSVFGTVSDPQIKGEEPQNRLVERSEEKKREIKNNLIENSEEEEHAREAEAILSENGYPDRDGNEPLKTKNYRDTLSYEKKKMYDKFLNKLKLLFLGEYKSHDYEKFIKYNEQRRWYGLSGENVIKNYKKYVRGWIEAGEKFYLQ